MAKRNKNNQEENVNTEVGTNENTPVEPVFQDTHNPVGPNMEVTVVPGIHNEASPVYEGEKEEVKED